MVPQWWKSLQQDAQQAEYQVRQLNECLLARQVGFCQSELVLVQSECLPLTSDYDYLRHRQNINSLILNNAHISTYYQITVIKKTL